MNVWIDLENTPHAMVFRPIIERLRSQGHKVFLTAKDSRQTTAMLKMFGLSYTKVGSTHATGLIKKIGLVFTRALQLTWVVRKRGIFDVSISHGSRSHVIASALAKIPCITSYDYEYSSKFLIHELADIVLVPESLSQSEVLQGKKANTLFYPGYKEELYLADFVPNPSFNWEGLVPNNSVMILLRPPATDGHYHDKGAARLFEDVIRKILQTANALGVIIPRDKKQLIRFQQKWKGENKILVMTEPQNGLDMIWRADLVVGAGGTMNREAALMHTPVYSIFTGRLGSIDKRLINSGRMKHISSPNEIPKIQIRKKDETNNLLVRDKKTLDFFVNVIEKFNNL